MSSVKLHAAPLGPRPSDAPPPPAPHGHATSEVRPVAPRTFPPPPEPVDSELAWLDAQLAAELDVADSSDDAPDTDRHPTSIPPRR